MTDSDSDEHLVSVTVTDDDGEPIGMATVEINENVTKVTFLVGDEDGDGIDNVEILIDDETYETDSSGEAVIEIAAGEYTAVISADNYDDEEVDVSLDWGESVTEVVTLMDPADAEVSASDGTSAIQGELDDASSGDRVLVTGSGEYDWDETVEVPNNTTLEFADGLEFVVPSNHDITGYVSSGSTIYSIITNADRSNAQNVTIRGGEFDMYNMDETAHFAGVWLHNANDSQIEEVVCSGAGYESVYGHSDYRSYNICLTASDNCGVYDSEGHDSGYDDIGLRGANTNCEVVRCSGSGGSSGTIQDAPWGGWDIGSGAGENTLFEDCEGRRIYAHGTVEMEFDNCESHYRIQTLGARDVHIHGTQDFEGKVLLYTNSPDVSTALGGTLVEEMTISPDSDQDIAFQIGTNGPDSGDIEIRDVEVHGRPEFLWFESYASNAGSIDDIHIHDCEIEGSGSSATIAAQASGIPTPSLLHFENCEFDGFDTGITGTYDTVIVEDCTFNDFASEDEAIDVTGDLETSDNIYADEQAETGNLSVSGIDTITNTRFEGIEVTVEQIDGDEGPHTGITGEGDQPLDHPSYEFGQLPVGFYTITAEHEDYDDEEYDEDYWREGDETSMEAMYLDEGGRQPLMYMQPTDIDEFYDLTPEIPSEAWNLYQSKPDVRDEYSTVSASGYENRSGDLGSLLQSASSDNAIVELDSGEYEMSSTLSGGGTMGLVGEGSDETTIYYTGSDLRDLIDANPSNIVVEGVTFDISEGSGSDVGVVRAQISNEGWFQDIVLRGQRDRHGTASGGRFTFLIQTESSATALIDYVRFPDGDEYYPEEGSVGHAIPMNTDPVTGGNGLTVWKDCFVQDFIDNGMYIANHNNGRNILWNCHGRNCSSGVLRIGGGHDTIIGGTTIVDDLASGSGSALVVNHDGLSEAIGLHIEGHGDNYGAEAIQLRSDLDDVLLDRVTMYTNGSSRPARLSAFDNQSNSTVELKDCYWLDESPSGSAQTVIRHVNEVIADSSWHSHADNRSEVSVESSGSLTMSGSNISTGTYSASDLGLSDPRPLPEFYFSDDETRDPDDIIEDYWSPAN